MLKQKPHRSANYIKWVKSLECCNCCAPAHDPHHIIGHGVGGAGTTASDLFAMPICRSEHSRLHHDPKHWEEMNGSQWEFVVATLNIAISKNVIDLDTVLTEIEGQVKNIDDKKMLIESIFKD